MDDDLTYYLENKTGNKTMFYKISRDKRKVDMFYGAIGSVGASTFQIFDDEAYAIEFVKKQLSSKFLIGYAEIKNSADSENSTDDNNNKMDIDTKMNDDQETFSLVIIPESTAPYINEKPWKCYKCTFLNDSGLSSICKICSQDLFFHRNLVFRLEKRSDGNTEFCEIYLENNFVGICSGVIASQSVANKVSMMFKSADEADTYCSQCAIEKRLEGYTDRLVAASTGDVSDEEGDNSRSNSSDDGDDGDESEEDEDGDVDEEYESEEEENKSSKKGKKRSAKSSSKSNKKEKKPTKRVTKKSKSAVSTSSSSIKGWTCKECTYANEDSLSISCALCDSARSISKGQSLVAGAIAQAPASTSSSTSPSNTVYMECHEGSSDKFYELIQTDCQVSVRYGKNGTSGAMSLKQFANSAEAKKFVEKTANDKRKKGYEDKSPSSSSYVSVSSMTPSANPLEDLENGLKVFVKGSSSLPYTLKKFNGGYSCSCQGFLMTIRIKGIQATTCRHLKEVRGEEAEAIRCASSAGIVANPSSKNNKNAGIPGKISLAQKWKLSLNPTGYYMSEKLDGMRAYWDGTKLWTRSGLPIITPTWFLHGLPSDLHLDGELFLGRKLFSECMSIARRTDASDDWNQLTYVIFDAPTVKGGIIDRLNHAKAILSTSPPKYAKIHEHVVCTGTEHLLDELAKIESVDGEGLMLRHPTAPHRGGRNTDLLKVKSFHDDEALIIDYEKGKGKYQGLVGSLVCISKTGAQFKVGSGLTDDMRSYNAIPKIGTVITYKYFELTSDGIPRFPTFMRIRPDVDKSVFPAIKNHVHQMYS